MQCSPPRHRASRSRPVTHIRRHGLAAEKGASSQPHAFTLVEMLVTVMIVGLLAALLLPVIGKARNSGAQAKGIANLRQIGLAVQTFATENENRLPGPAPLGVLSYYNRAGRNSSHAFPAKIAPYLGLPDAATLPTSQDIIVPALEDPGFKITMLVSTNAPNFVQNPVLSDEPGVEGKKHIFGNIATSGLPATNPLTIFDVVNLGGPSKVWMLTTTDQQLPAKLTNKSGWIPKLPPAPPYGKSRLRLFVDGHVETVPLDAPLL